MPGQAFVTTGGAPGVAITPPAACPPARIAAPPGAGLTEATISGGTGIAIGDRQGPAGPPGAEGPPGRDGDSGDRVVVQVAIAVDGQTVFPLKVPPTVFFTARMIVNGTEFRAPDIGVSATAITWLNRDFRLERSDVVFIAYA